MSALTQIVGRVMGGRRTGGPMTGAGRTGRVGPTARGRAGGTRSQDQAIGRGVRSLLRRFR